MNSLFSKLISVITYFNFVNQTSHMDNLRHSKLISIMTYSILSSRLYFSQQVQISIPQRYMLVFRRQGGNDDKTFMKENSAYFDSCKKCSNGKKADWVSQQTGQLAVDAFQLSYILMAVRERMINVVLSLFNFDVGFHYLLQHFCSPLSGTNLLLLKYLDLWLLITIYDRREKIYMNLGQVVWSNVGNIL